MCGRVRLSSDYSEIKIKLKFATDSAAPNFEADWNRPPTAPMLVAIQSCAILTCGPNTVMGELHTRMPVILAESDWPKWLGEEPATEDELLALLKPCPDEALKIWQVNKMIGNVRNKGRELIQPLALLV
jgi:putative SOS response-associated peptidase YedK